MVKDLNDPTNVDTVPAWLTEGEFVLNKEATAMFGPTIERMNQAGLQQRHAENQMVKANTGMMIPAGGGYNVGGLVTFLKEKEGYEDNAYQDDAGVWTIGYGRTTNPDGSAVQPGQTTQREKEDSWLQTRAASELEAVKGYATKYGYDLNDGQLNALASFRYNGGQGMLDMLTDNGQRDLATIQQKFGQYNKVTDPKTGEKVFVQGLQNRRDAELELWSGTTPTETQPAPQPLASNETTQAIVTPPPEELPPPPTQAINAALVEANQPAVPQQEVAAPQAAENFLPTIADGLKLGAGAPEMLQPVPQLQQVNPEFIPSVTAQAPAQAPIQGSNPRDRNQFGFNGGGQVQYLRNGGRANITEEERERRRLARLQAAGNTSGGRNNARLSPEIRAKGPAQPPVPYRGQHILPLPTQHDSPPNAFGGQAGAMRGRIAGAQFANQQPPSVPSIDDQPPVPGSDEAILQGSSQQVEQGESERARQNALLGNYAKQFPKGDPRRAAAFNRQQHQKGAVHPGVIPELPPTPPQAQPGFTPTGGRGAAPIEQLSEEAIGQAYDRGDPRAIEYAKRQEQGQLTDDALRQAQLQQAVTAPDAPGAPFIDARVQQLQQQGQDLGSEGTGITTQPASDPGINQAAPDIPLGPGDVGAVPGIDTQAPKAPKAPDAREKAIANREPAEKAAMAQAKVDEIIKKDPAAATPPPKEQLAEAKAAAQRVPAEGVNRAKGVLQDTFGDLFDKKELGRMAVLFAGAMVTGMSPAAALAFAGTNYIQRLDAQAANKAATHKALVTGGKYSAASVKAYMDSNDPSDLIPVGVAPEATGKFKTMFAAGGRKVVVQEMKVGKNTILVDQNGKQVNGYALQEDPSNVRGTPEWRTRVKTSSGQIKDQLTEMRKQFDTFQTADGEGSKTDILPSTSSAKIAEWAAENGVEPDQLGGLVESAYHDALNDRRQDGARARDLVPYLQQLVVRQQVGGNADVFKAKGWNGEGTPQYVNPSKLKVLNTSVHRLLTQKLGKKGNVSDLSNMFYTEALKDWNELTPGVKAEWERSAQKDESGFYKFAEKMVLQGSL